MGDQVQALTGSASSRLRARAAAVGLASAATVAAEVLLVRRLGVEHFHHFAYLAVGVAMLGYGASGTALATVPARPGWFRLAAGACAISLVAAPILAGLVRLDATQLAWSAAEWPRLGLLIAILATPFAAGGAVTLLAVSSEPQAAGRIYGASFAGGAVGALIALASLWVTTPARALAAPALLGAFAALAARAPAAALLALAGTSLFATPLGELRLTPYKSLPQLEAMPGARRVLEKASPVGWVVAVEAPAFRFAPGLSLAYRGAFPRQTALLVDGDVAGALSEPSELARWLPSAAPYALGAPRSALAIGAGEIESARSHGASRVVGIELHPALAELLGAEAGDARALVARMAERFDVVAIGPSSGPGASAAGVHALDEDAIHTVEAYAAFLARLEPGGTFAVTRWSAVPERESLRTLLTAAEALRQSGGDPARGLAVVRSWATATVLLRPGGFAENDIERLRHWCAERLFDVDFHPGLAAPPSAPFNAADSPTLYLAAAAAARSAEEARRFASAYPYDVAPVGDARPYPHHFVRPGGVLSLLRAPSGLRLPFAEWGPIAVVATLVLGGALGAALLLMPIAAGSPRPRRLWYFAALGFGYLAAELAAIQQLGLLLGHPVYAVAAALISFLACSGAGSAFSDRLAVARAWWPSVAASILLGCAAAGLLPLVHALQGAPLALRGLAGGLLSAPVAFALGMPFALGLRRVAPDGGAPAAWAWAVNGFASVVAAPLSALIALEAGSPALFAAAALAYALAAALIR
jgi:hypothetical protein